MLLYDERRSLGCCFLRNVIASSKVSFVNASATGRAGISDAGRLVMKSLSFATYLMDSFLFRAAWTLGWNVSMSKNRSSRMCFFSGNEMKACKCGEPSSCCSSEIIYLNFGKMVCKNSKMSSFDNGHWGYVNNIFFAFKLNVLVLSV